MSTRYPADPTNELWNLYRELSSRSSYESKLCHSTKGDTARTHWGRYQGFNAAALLVKERYDLLAEKTVVPF